MILATSKHRRTTFRSREQPYFRSVDRPAPQALRVHDPMILETFILISKHTALIGYFFPIQRYLPNMDFLYHNHDAVLLA